MGQDKQPGQSGTGEHDQDTPGRPKSSSSRQQTHPDQGIQSGNSDLDHKSQSDPKVTPHARKEK